MFVLGNEKLSGYHGSVAIDRKQLPANADVLQQMVLDLIAQLDAEQARRIKTEHLLQQLLQAKSGRRSEQLSPDQLALFAAELKAQGVNLEEAISEDEYSNHDDDAPTSPAGNTEASQPRGRRPMPPHLKRERIVHDLAEGEKHCQVCAQDLRPIGEESSERYEFIPAQVIVIEDIRKKYACACTVKTATKPSQPIEKSNAGAGLLTQVIVAKYADHLPLHRQAKMFRRWGVELADQTLCGWPYIGDRHHEAVIYDYTATRERAGPEKFLKSYRGYLQADAYVAYDSFFTDPRRGMVEVGCWAHARRHFHNALDSDQKRMSAVLLLIAQLYAVEKIARRSGLSGEALRLAREHGARPALDRLHAYLIEIQDRVLPKSEAGQAVAYTLKNWTALTRYCSDADLPIDNNRTERSAATGPFSAATGAARPRQCCAVSLVPASW
jgi:transposase